MTSLPGPDAPDKGDVVADHPITDAELAAWSAICAAATPGPWYVEIEDSHPLYRRRGWLRRVGPIGLRFDGNMLDVRVDDLDVALVLAARLALPRLIAEVKRLRADIAELEALYANANHWTSP
jgi:hypothetical protein